MDEDQILQSIIADPKLTDPSIDVSQFRQTTETNPLLLANVPEFSGLKLIQLETGIYEICIKLMVVDYPCYQNQLLRHQL